MKKLFSAVKVMAVICVVASSHVMATAIGIDWSGTQYQGDGTSPIHLQNIAATEVFEFNSDISGVAQIAKFDGDLNPNDYGYSSPKGETLSLFADPDSGASDWYIQADFSTLSSNTISLQLRSNWFCEFGFFAVCDFGDLLINSQLFELNVMANQLDFNDGNDLLYTGVVSGLNAGLDPFGFAGKNVQFNLIQARSNNDGTLVNDGNALLSFNVVEVTEPGSIALWSALLVLFFRVSKKSKVK